MYVFLETKPGENQTIYTNAETFHTCECLKKKITENMIFVLFFKYHFLIYRIYFVNMQK